MVLRLLNDALSSAEVCSINLHFNYDELGLLFRSYEVNNSMLDYRNLEAFPESLKGIKICKVDRGGHFRGSFKAHGESVRFQVVSHSSPFETWQRLQKSVVL